MTEIESVEPRCEALSVTGDIPPYRCTTSATGEAGRSAPAMPVPCAFAGLTMLPTSEPSKRVRCEAIMPVRQYFGM